MPSCVSASRQSIAAVKNGCMVLLKKNLDPQVSGILSVTICDVLRRFETDDGRQDRELRHADNARFFSPRGGQISFP